MRPLSIPPLLLHVTLSLVAASQLGCFAYGRGQRDVDRTPIMNTGAGATILYPGQAPPLPGSPAPGVATPSGAVPGQPGVAPENAAGARSGTASGSGSVSMIGGAQRDEQSHAEYREDPIWRLRSQAARARAGADRAARHDGAGAPGPQGAAAGLRGRAPREPRA
jgi:hypothetical protein